MKKLSINFLCVLIIVVLAASLLYPVYKLGYSFGAGFRAGLEQAATNGKKADISNVDVYFEPDAERFLYPKDSLEFADGSKLPVTYTRGTVYVDADKSNSLGTTAFIDLLCLVGQGVFFILMLVQFVKFVINLNKGRIFVADNVRRLRKIALWLILMSVFGFACVIADEVAVSNLGLELPHYRLSSYTAMPWDVLIIGLVALLMAQAWSRGIQLREDQELTI